MIVGVDGMEGSCRLESLIGEENFQKVKKLKVAIIGLGGVGGYVVEALARCFVDTLYLVDFDQVDISNKNRQLIALSSTIGRKKTEVWKERVLEINPDCQVIMIGEKLQKENMEQLFSYPIDYVVDACDTIKTKMELIRICTKKNIPIISCMGTALKNKPELLEIKDLRQTSYDPLARPLRKMVKAEHISKKIPVVYSKEPVLKRKKELGSCIFVPAVAGLLCANYVIRDWTDTL